MKIRTMLLLLTLALAGCSSAPKHPAITAPVRTSIAGSIAASERSSVKIREFRTNAERIEYKASRALRFFDAQGKPEVQR